MKIMNDITELKNDLFTIKAIDDLLSFLNKLLYDINEIVIKYISKIDFYDLFNYIVDYNSSSNNTHRLAVTNFNIENQLCVSDTSFINKLKKLDISTIKNINDKLIKFFYEYFKIDIGTLICASDGSNIKLLASLKKSYKLNKNELYTNATINCLYDVNNQVPISFDIFKSFNEVDNLVKQFEDKHIKTNNYKIICVTDRGYDKPKLINFYIKNDVFFVSRLVKTNAYIKNLNNNNNSTIFETTINKKICKLKIIKYTNVKKPDFLETKEELSTLINDKQCIINNKKNIKINLTEEINNYKINNKKNVEIIKNNFNNFQIKKDCNKIIVVNRAKKTVAKEKLKLINEDIKKVEQEKTVLKIKYKNLIDYDHSDYYILTNNIELSDFELKKIYRKRWTVETSYRFDKFKLNLNQMNNKNPIIIKHNVYAIQFIQIINAFIQQILKKYIKKDHHLNVNHIYDCLHKYVFTSFHKLLKLKKKEHIQKITNNKQVDTHKNLKNKKNKKNKKKSKTNKDKLNKINNDQITESIYEKIMSIFKTMLKYQIKYIESIKVKPRIKKRQSNGRTLNDKTI